MGERKAGEDKVWKTSSATDISVARMQIIAEEYHGFRVALVDRFHRATWSHACVIFSGRFKGASATGFAVVYICDQAYLCQTFDTGEKRDAVVLYNRYRKMCNDVEPTGAKEEEAAPPRRKSRAKAGAAAAADGGMAGDVEK